MTAKVDTESSLSAMTTGSALTDLRSLNAGSARVATFLVKICYPREVKYTKAHILRAGWWEHDYCEGTVRGQKAALALQEYKDGQVYKMSRITFSQKTKVMFIASELKMVVEMSATTWERVKEGDQRLPMTCASKHTVEDVLSMSSKMQLDMVALVRNVSDSRAVPLKTGGTAMVCDIELVDGSSVSDGSLLCLAVSCWSSELGSKLKSAVGHVVSLLFLGVQPLSEGCIRFSFFL